MGYMVELTYNYIGREKYGWASIAARTEMVYKVCLEGEK